MKASVLLALLVVGCTGAKPTVVTPPPLVEPEPEVDVSPAVRAVLEEFLTARWRFDYDAMNAFVTPADAAEPWRDPAEEQIVKARRRSDPRDFYSWSIEEVVVDGETATASVQLIGPGLHDSMAFQLRTSVRMIKATARWLRDPGKQEAEIGSIMPPRQVRALTYRLRLVDGAWRVFMDWPGVRAMKEERDDALREELFAAFDGSEKSLHDHRSPVDERTQALLEAVDEAERAVRDRDIPRARELYDALLVSDPAIPDFLAARRDSLDELEAQQKAKLAAAELEIGSLREVDGKYELRVKNLGRDLRSFRLVAEYVDDDGERSYRTLYERSLKSGESSTVLVHPRRAKSATHVRLVDVSFLDRDFDRTFAEPADAQFEMRLRDLRTGGVARSSADRVANVFDEHLAEFDACPWAPDDDPVDVWVEVESPPGAKVARALTPPDSELGRCLSTVAAQLSYPDAEDNRSIVRVYPPTHWWRLTQ